MPMMINVAPQGPTMASSTKAIEGLRACASASWRSTPIDRRLTSISSASTHTNPMIVARPTSERLAARRE
ncbi:hypothetical protein D3C71_1236340 [compost metagenome]